VFSKRTATPQLSLRGKIGGVCVEEVSRRYNVAEKKREREKVSLEEA